MKKDHGQGMDERFLSAYESHADSVYRFGLLKLSDKDAALDLVQDVFMRYWDVLRKDARATHERAFLFTIARNLVIDRYRAKRTVSLDRLREEDGFEPPETGLPDPERAAEGKRAFGLIGRLPDAYREALILRYVEGFEPRDIAALLGESADAVTVRLHRGIKKLRELMHERNTHG
ncbi:MAG TPA: RNA polymerase sigma factor [Candidatus Paceibacterota bacterium]|nr:RNA polymerase sigma factor [Candidatus Paceibacterota bacterium]